MVTIEHLTLSYREKTVLTDISLEIQSDECVLFTGESGSGKSSLIHAINGLATRYDRADVTGKIVIDGRDSREMELYEISMLVSSVFQNPKTHFFNVNTTLELLFYLENIGLSREDMDLRLEDMLRVFPIEHLLNRDIFKLSGGEKQILSLASSYIAGTDVVLLDEPSSNLDEESIDIVKQMLAILKKKGKTLILAEHRLYYLLDLADRIVLIDDGRVKCEYAAREFAALSEENLRALGLRSREKTPLAVPSLPDKGSLEIKKLEYPFPQGNGRLVVEDAAFETGHIYGIVGANGRGKSTFVRCLIGVEKHSKESIYFHGRRLSKKDRLRMSSLVMQDVNHQLFTDSVEHEICLGNRQADPGKVDEILETLDLDGARNRHPMSLSGGQKQRVAIASVLADNSHLLFFDEPTSGMDYTNMARISRLIKACRRDDNIIFIVSHDTEFLNVTANYILQF
ncbi:MAG: ABC transporter ATP-binding protein [Peptoniphilus sp.]|nr:ABC transporter ATP-binding protein [Peptoniphilus sp.]MDD7363080.1 ABC transporter ATP-binding protein [Bacillota bacterium]MDY6044408.1 ABC transporter ATP-binding protein [Peptoniphilus sp.]